MCEAGSRSPAAAPTSLLFAWQIAELAGSANITVAQRCTHVSLWEELWDACSHHRWILACANLLVRLCSGRKVAAIELGLRAPSACRRRSAAAARSQPLGALNRSSLAEGSQARCAMRVVAPDASESQASVCKQSHPAEKQACGSTSTRARVSSTLGLLPWARMVVSEEERVTLLEDGPCQLERLTKRSRCDDLVQATPRARPAGHPCPPPPWPPPAVCLLEPGAPR